MIEKDNLRIFFTFYLSASANSILLCRVQVWVHIDYLSVTTVSEKETCVRVRVDFEIRRISVLNLLAFPRVITQICNLRLDLLSLRENEAEVFVFHTISQVNICTDLTFITLISDEKNRGQSTVPKTFFTLCKLLKESISSVGVACASKCLHLRLLLVLSGLNGGFLALFKLLTSQKLSLAMTTNFIELAHEVRIF